MGEAGKKRKRSIPRVRKKNRKTYSPNQLLRAVNNYFSICEEEGRVPTMTGLSLHLGVNRVTMYEWGRDEEYAEILEAARDCMKTWCAEEVWDAQGVAAGKIAFMKNVFGWSEKIEQETRSVNLQMTVEEARKKLEQYAPKLLEIIEAEVVREQ